MLMRNKIIIIIFIVLILFTLIFLNMEKNTYAIDNNDSKYYELPIIYSVLFNNDSATITAGMYYYGDLNLDGKIDDIDIKFMNSLLKETLTFSDEQKKLVDFDKNGEITEKDLELLKTYVEQNKDLKYETYGASLLYCINNEDNYNNCNWQNNNIISIEEEREYYAFVKNKNSNSISDSYKFKFEKIMFNYGDVVNLD